MNDNHYQQNLYMKINLTITGCMGRMGQQLIKSSNKNKNFKLVSLTENFKINKKIFLKNLEKLKTKIPTQVSKSFFKKQKTFGKIKLK